MAGYTCTECCANIDKLFENPIASLPEREGAFGRALHHIQGSGSPEMTCLSCHEYFREKQRQGKQQHRGG